jgi:hypothetical protein
MSIINFMVYCNGVMFFHKLVDWAQPGCELHIQGNYYSPMSFFVTSSVAYACVFLYEIEKVVIELDEQHIVQIMINNGSNYEKACRMVSRKYWIVWKPCLLIPSI